MRKKASTATHAGISDREAAREIMNRYADSGGDIGSWATNEIAREQLEPLLEAVRAEIDAQGDAAHQTQIGVYAALQHLLQRQFPQAWEAFKGSAPARKVSAEAGTIIQLYQAEDDVFRLAAWLKAKEGGASDLEAGKVSRRSFLDYSVNAPWVQMMRGTFWPFFAFTYRAVPMLLETAARKPHKLIKLMGFAAALNALGVALAGGGDDERKLLPEEKAGGIWGLVPKLIRMPWNDEHGSPVYLDIRRFIPVGDVLDVGQGQAAVPVLPGLQPGGPLVVMGELLANRSLFTGKDIVHRDTDTAGEQATKVLEHLYKAFTPNILGLPGTYATSGVADAMNGRTDAFGREMSVSQAVGSSFGVKLGSYPADVLRRNLQAKAQAEIREIELEKSSLRRQRQTNRISQEDYEEGVRRQMEKERKVKLALAEKLGG